MKIGIIGAMDEEVSILKSAMNNVTTTSIAGCEFYQGDLNGSSRCNDFIVRKVLTRHCY